MNLIESVVGKTLVFFLKRDVEKIRIARKIQKHIAEQPKSGDNLKYEFIRPEIAQAVEDYWTRGLASAGNYSLIPLIPGRK